MKNSSEILAGQESELHRLKTENASLKDKLAEADAQLKSTQERLIKKAIGFKVLNKYSLELAVQKDEDLYGFIVNSFKSFFSVKEAWISIYDSKNKELILKATTLSEKDNALVVRRLGQKLIDFRTPVNEDTYKMMINLGIGDPSSLHDISFGNIPKLISSALGRIFSIGWFQGVVLTDKGKLYGGLLTAGHMNQEPLEKAELSYFADLTSQVLRKRQVEKELLMSESKFREFADLLPQLIFESDMDGIITFINQFGLDILGYSRDEINSGINIFSFIAPEDIEFAKLSFVKTLAGSGPIPREFGILRSDGNTFPLLLNAVLYHEDGKAKGIRGTGIDITDRKKFEKELENKNIQLKKTIAEKDRFFSIIAHDLRSPFNYFLGFTEILTDEINRMSPDRIREITLNMRKSAVNLYSLLENLLEWSRMQRGIIEFSPVLVNLDEKVKDCVEMVNGPALKKNIHIQIEIPKDLSINTDPHMFCTIIRNLVTNAIKFTPGGGKIMISASPASDNRAEIMISDTGIGMDQELLGKLFSINDEIRRKGTEGELSAGLGLLLCHEFVVKHGGTISAESEVGKGSTFKIVI